MSGADPYLGEILVVAFNFAPRNWAECDGRLLPISSYSALFSLLGTAYGGDGRTTFAVPDLRGRVGMHVGNAPDLSDRRLGQKLGDEEVTLTAAHLPSHTHTLRWRNQPADTADPAGASLAVGSAPLYADDPTPDLTMGSLPSAGGGQARPNRQPVLALRAIISLVGVYPSRN